MTEINLTEQFVDDYHALELQLDDCLKTGTTEADVKRLRERLEAAEERSDRQELELNAALVELQRACGERDAAQVQLAATQAELQETRAVNSQRENCNRQLQERIAELDAFAAELSGQIRELEERNGKQKNQLADNDDTIRFLREENVGLNKLVQDLRHGRGFR